MKRFRKTMGMLLAVIMISMTMFSGTIAHAAGTMAFSVGTDYGGLFGVDTTSDATNASDLYEIAGYNSSVTAEKNYYYYAEIKGAWNQLGTDTMRFRYNPY